MLSRTQGIEISKEFLKTSLPKEEWFLKVRQSVKAFVLYGSVAKETNNDKSDIDILVILPINEEKENTEGEYFYDFKNFKINIVLRSIEKLRIIATEKTDIFQREIFRKSEILMDSDGEVTKLLKEINQIENYASKFIGDIVTIKIDRPINSKHPKYNFIYETNYGFVPDTKAPDGKEVDAYLLGVKIPVEKFTGKCIAVIHRKDDNDDKLIIIPEDAKDMGDKEILEAINFQEKWFDSVVIRK